MSTTFQAKGGGRGGTSCRLSRADKQQTSGGREGRREGGRGGGREEGREGGR